MAQIVLRKGVISFVRRKRVDRSGDMLLEMPGDQLAGSDLSGRQLHFADLEGIDLHGTNLYRATLNGAALMRADLRDCNLSRAILVGADMSDADLRGANLTGCWLTWADLRGANLGGAMLEGAHLDAIKHDDRTTWPAGFDVESIPAEYDPVPTRRNEG